MRFEELNRTVRNQIARRKFVLGGGVATFGAFAFGLSLNDGRRATPTALSGEVNTRARRALSAENQITGELAATRSEHADTILFHDNTAALFGADIDPDTGSPTFMNDGSKALIRQVAPNADMISGIETTESGQLAVTEKSLRNAKKRWLDSIRNPREPITRIISMHGNINHIALGKFPDRENPTKYWTLIITPEELAAAYAHRHRRRSTREEARENPDVLFLLSCQSGTFGEKFSTEVRRNEEAWYRSHSHLPFRPMMPVLFTASTADELAYISQPLPVISSTRTLGGLYPHADFIGTRRNHSNPEIHVPDRQSGELIQIGENETGTRFG